MENIFRKYLLTEAFKQILLLLPKKKKVLLTQRLSEVSYEPEIFHSLDFTKGKILLYVL